MLYSLPALKLAARFSESFISPVPSNAGLYFDSTRAAAMSTRSSSVRSSAGELHSMVRVTREKFWFASAIRADGVVLTIMATPQGYYARTVDGNSLFQRPVQLVLAYHFQFTIGANTVDLAVIYSSGQCAAYKTVFEAKADMRRQFACVRRLVEAAAVHRCLLVVYVLTSTEMTDRPTQEKRECWRQRSLVPNVTQPAIRRGRDQS